MALQNSCLSVENNMAFIMKWYKYECYFEQELVMYVLSMAESM